MGRAVGKIICQICAEKRQGGGGEWKVGERQEEREK